MPLYCRLAAVAAIVAAMAGAPAGAETKSAPKSALSLESVTVHLFLEESGTLSGDASGAPGISGANMRALLPGDKREPFHDFLVKVVLTSKGEVFAKGRQASVAIIDARSRRTLETHAISDVYVGAGGRIVKAVWVRERMCQALEVRVIAGPRTITRKLAFHCGE